jgi:hypothetical protein
MNKRIIFLSLIVFALASYFIISCTHQLPLPTTGPCPSITVALAGANPTSSAANDGSISATVTGGVSPYTYNVNGGAYGTSSSFIGLAAGTYIVSVKDANNCPGISNAITLTMGGPNPCPTISVSATGTNPTSSTSADGSISVSVTGGVAPYTYRINSGSYGSSSSFTGLVAGSYIISVKDANNCPGTSSVVTLTGGTTNCPSITVGVTHTNTSTICAADGTVTVSATGGTSPYSFSKNGTTFQTVGSFNSLTTGSYTITAKDANGCLGTTSVIIAGPGTVSFATQVKPIINSYCGSSQISCHNHNNNWTTYSDIVGSSSGTTWSSNLSTFLGRIRNTNGSANSICPLVKSSGNHNMPPSSSTAWTNFVKAELTNWIDQGYPNN